MSISERKQKILKAVIDDYIETAEPVGSKAIAGKPELQLSPATIRNEMAELEDMGYLEQPHTSSGRIPSPKGYRLYVDVLMRSYKLSLLEMERINDVMHEKIGKLDHLLTEAARLISQITSYPTYSLATGAGSISIRKFELIFLDALSFIAVLMTSVSTVKNKLFRMPHNADEQQLKSAGQTLNRFFSGLSQFEYSPELINKAVESSGSLGAVVSVVIGYALEVMNESDGYGVAVSGAPHLLQQPEYQDISKAHKMLNYLSEESELARIPAPNKDNSMRILIGPENVAEALRDASVVVASYNIGDNVQGLIGIVGPTRMDYAKISAKLAYFADNIGKIMLLDEADKIEDEKD